MSAGKGGTSKAIAEQVSPRVCSGGDRPAGPDRQGEDQLYFPAAISRICRPPAKSSFSTAAGYNRAGVERVMGLQRSTKWKNSLARHAPLVRAVDGGVSIILLKY